MPHEEKIKAYVGLGVALVFSLCFLALLVRASRKAANLNYRLLGILALGLVGCVTLIGDAPYVSLVQNVTISLGLLVALFFHMKREEQANVRLVGLLVASMLSCLVINQASRSFEIGLLRWFKIDVGASKEQIPILARVESGFEKENQLLSDDMGILSNRLESVSTSVLALRTRIDESERTITEKLQLAVGLTSKSISKAIEQAAMSETPAILKKNESDASTPKFQGAALVKEAQQDGDGSGTPAPISPPKPLTIGEVLIPSTGLDVVVKDSETKRFLTDDFRIYYARHMLGADELRIVNVKSGEPLLNVSPASLHTYNLNIVGADKNGAFSNRVGLLIKDLTSSQMTVSVFPQPFRRRKDSDSDP